MKCLQASGRFATSSPGGTHLHSPKCVYTLTRTGKCKCMPPSGGRRSAAETTGAGGHHWIARAGADGHAGCAREGSASGVENQARAVVARIRGPKSRLADGRVLSGGSGAFGADLWMGSAEGLRRHGRGTCRTWPVQKMSESEDGACGCAAQRREGKVAPEVEPTVSGDAGRGARLPRAGHRFAVGYRSASYATSSSSGSDHHPEGPRRDRRSGATSSSTRR
jgi:hypothetical protein